MALIDQIELLGASVDDGLISREEAAQLLVEYSERGLTLRGALDALDNHKTRRAEYDRIFRRTSRMHDVLTAVVEAASPEEQAAAEIALLAEQDQQSAAMRDEMRERLLRGDL